jgi:hypothetical protein
MTFFTLVLLLLESRFRNTSCSTGMMSVVVYSFLSYRLLCVLYDPRYLRTQLILYSNDLYWVKRILHSSSLLSSEVFEATFSFFSKFNLATYFKNKSVPTTERALIRQLSFQKQKIIWIICRCRGTVLSEEKSIIIIIIMLLDGIAWGLKVIIPFGSYHIMWPI